MTAKTQRQKAGIALVDAFGVAAKQHGWQEDQGRGQDVLMAKAEFDRLRDALVDFIVRNVK